MINEIFFVLYAKPNFLCHLIFFNWGNFLVCSVFQLYQSYSVIKNVNFFRAYDLQVKKEANRSK